MCCVLLEGDALVMFFCFLQGPWIVLVYSSFNLGAHCVFVVSCGGGGGGGGLCACVLCVCGSCCFWCVSWWLWLVCLCVMCGVCC